MLPIVHFLLSLFHLLSQGDLEGGTNWARDGDVVDINLMTSGYHEK